MEPTEFNDKIYIVKMYIKYFSLNRGVIQEQAEVEPTLEQGGGGVERGGGRRGEVRR